MARDKHFVTDVLLIIPANFRTTGKNLRATGLDSNLPSERFRFRRSGRSSLNACSDQNLILIPALYTNASIWLAIDGDRTATQRQCLFSNFAIVDQPVAGPAILATSQRFFFNFVFLRQDSNSAKYDQRNNQDTS